MLINLKNIRTLKKFRLMNPPLSKRNKSAFNHLYQYFHEMFTICESELNTCSYKAMNDME